MSTNPWYDVIAAGAIGFLCYLSYRIGRDRANVEWATRLLNESHKVMREGVSEKELRTIDAFCVAVMEDAQKNK